MNIKFKKNSGRKRGMQLGTMSLSPDILQKANMGLWAFELDEGQAPRMYVNDFMLGLIGLTEQIPPELTYHAWFDNIDDDAYGLVSEAVEKMAAGEPAEVQYPWHYPDGRTIIVRCGGVRNFEYTAGIRIEGIHQDVTEISHFDEDSFKLMKRQAAELRSSQLRADTLSFIADHEGDVSDYLEFFGDRIRKIVGCDQVIFQDINGKRTTFNAPGIEDVSTEICARCPFSKINSDAYKDGIAQLDDCACGINGVKPDPECEAKSSVMQHIYSNGKLAGLLTFHYLKEHHTFTEDELSMLKILAKYLGLLLGRMEAEKIKRELQRLQAQEDNETIAGLASEYVSLYYINLDNNVFRVYSFDGERLADTRKLLTQYTDMFDLVHRFAMDSVHPDDREPFMSLNSETIRERLKDVKKYSVRYRRDYGQGYLWSEMDVIKYEDKDKPANSVIFGFAERDKEIRREQEAEKKMEEQRVQLEEALAMARSASLAKTTFLNNMSHDIRTPMNAIIGFTGLAKSHIDDSVRVKDYLEKIGKSSDHLLSLINDVLDMSRIESGKMILNENDENIGDIVQTVKDMVQGEADKKNITFTIESADVVHKGVICDKLRLNQVLINVVSNAIKYTPAGGEVSMRVEEEAVKPSGYAIFEFRIKDNGIGMDQDFLQRIYEPFSRLKSSTISGIQGTGLGMAITKNIVDMMGGRINILSEPEQGTEVIITLDFKLQKDSLQAETLPENDFDIRGRRILLVEDNELNREIATAILEEFGGVVTPVEDGDIAVETIKAAEAGDFDIVLMDIQMPKMNGYEASMAIRALGTEISRIPIVAMTANAFEEDRRAAIEAGMNEHIAKPIDIDQLKKVLAEFIS